MPHRPQRQIAYSRASLTERLWRHFEKDPVTGCWDWKGSIFGDGYGLVYVGNKKTRPAHRVMFELLVEPIPAGMTLDHLCHNPSCVNPMHLEPVTPRENARRNRGVVGVNARKEACHRGHPFDEANTYQRPDGNRECRACRSIHKRNHRRRSQPSQDWR